MSLLMESLECYANGRPPVGRTVRPGPPLGPRDWGGYESAPVGRWGWAIGRVSPGVRTAIRPCRPPRSPYPRRQGRRPGSLFPQRAPWDQRKVREESELFYLPTASQQFSDGPTGAIAPPHLPEHHAVTTTLIRPIPLAA